MVNCNSYGQLIGKELTSCPFCGAIQKEKMFFFNPSNQMGYVPPQPAMSQPQQPGGYGQPRPVKANKQGGGKGKLIALISVIAVLLIAAVFAIILFAGPGALTMKGALKAYLESIADNDTKAYINACYPTKLYKALLKEKGMTKEEYFVFLEDKLNSEYEFVAVKDIKITYSSEYNKFDLRIANKAISEAYGINFNISKALDLKIEFKYMDRYGNWWDDFMYVGVIKVGFKWYVLDRF